MNLFRSLFRMCFALWQNYKQHYAWRRQFEQCIKEEIVEVSYKSFSELEVKKILILCPHADDEWIGCSSIISSSEYKTDVLYYNLYGYNQSIENKIVRDAEIKKCSLHYNFTLYSSNISENTIVKLLQSNCYDAVFVPSPIDWHWEHRLVFDNLVEGILSLNSKINFQVFTYFISVPNIGSEEIYLSFLEIDKQKQKWKYFSENYISQNMPVLRYKLQERLNCAKCNNYAAEVFQKKSIKQILELYEYIHQEKNIYILNSLSKEITNIYGIRKQCKEFKL